MNRELDMHHGHDGAGSATDPVCGMTVNPDEARARGLHAQHEGTDYFFCGKGCKLDFQEDPAKYLAPDYQPHM
jgi:Cu+-exporting ATPase